VTPASRDWGGFLAQWGLTALVGLPLSFILFMAPLGLGFSPVWSEETTRAAFLRVLMLGAMVSPYLFWIAMMGAFALQCCGKRSAMSLPSWLLAIQLLALLLLI
jgi:hypothetical protein